MTTRTRRSTALLLALAAAHAPARAQVPSPAQIPSPTSGAAPAQRPIAPSTPLSATVRLHANKPTIHLDGRPVYPMIYALTDVPGGRWSWEEVPQHNIRTFCRAGVEMVQVDLAFDHVWMEDGRIDLDLTRRQLAGALEACPGAALFIRFHVNAPKWWIARHPEEQTRYADKAAEPDYAWGLQRLLEDDPRTPTRESIASTRWLAEAGGKLREYLIALQALPEARRLAGVQVAGGVYGEWHYWGFLDNEPDIGAPMQAYFRRWLREKYGSDAALRRAWGTDVTLATAQVPGLEARRTTSHGPFRDPVRERAVIDYYEAQHQTVADAILHFARIVKESWPRPIITGAFYGYFYAVFAREAAGGHLQLQRVLESPHIDYLSAPAAYYPAEKEMGDPYRSRGLIASVTHHGKLWLDEMDQRPPLVGWTDTAYATTVAKSIAQTRRNLLFSFSKGQGLWFYDFGPSAMTGGPRLAGIGAMGWWDDPYLMADVAALKRVMDRTLDRPYRTGADVLLVHDTDVHYHLESVRNWNGAAHQANNYLPLALFRAGVVFDPVHVDDLATLDLSPYRTVVFANTYLLTAEQRRAIEGRVARGGRHLVWVYAPGYSNGARLDASHITAVTGMRIREGQPGSSRIAVRGVADTAMTISLATDALRPRFRVDDPAAEVLGTFVDGGGAAVARKARRGSTSWYVAVPSASGDFWRALMQRTGAHLFTSPGAIVYAGAGTVTVHVAEGGARTVRLRNGREVRLEMAPNSTVLLDAETGASLLPEVPARVGGAVR